MEVPVLMVPYTKAASARNVVDIRKLYAQTGMFTYDPRLHVNGCPPVAPSPGHRRRQQRELPNASTRIEQLATNCDYLETRHLLPT
jgi:citrate synthase